MNQLDGQGWGRLRWRAVLDEVASDDQLPLAEDDVAEVVLSRMERAVDLEAPEQRASRPAKLEDAEFQLEPTPGLAEGHPQPPRAVRPHPCRPAGTRGAKAEVKRRVRDRLVALVDDSAHDHDGVGIESHGDGVLLVWLDGHCEIVTEGSSERLCPDPVAKARDHARKHGLPDSGGFAPPRSGWPAPTWAPPLG